MKTIKMFIKKYLKILNISYFTVQVWEPLVSEKKDKVYLKTKTTYENFLQPKFFVL